jgi:hypothetical protein
MKSTTLVLFLISCLHINAQSFFNERGESSGTIALTYEPNVALDVTSLSFTKSIKGIVDITPFASIGSRNFVTVFSGGVIGDYYLLKQTEDKLPLSFSLGAGYNFTLLSGFGDSSISHIGSVRGRVYHRIRVEHFDIIPRVGYLHRFFLEELDANDGALDVGVAFGYKLKNDNLITVTPSLLFPEGDTQFGIQLGYLFGRWVNDFDEVN